MSTRHTDEHDHDPDRDAERIRSTLDLGVSNMPDDDREALARARATAVAAAGRRPRGASWLRPAAALATAASLAVVAVLMLKTPADAPLSPDTAATDFELLVSGEDLSLYEDLDLILWLDVLDESA